MDFYFGLILSMLIFAPGLLVLGICCTVGLIMLLERSGVLGKSKKLPE